MLNTINLDLICFPAKSLCIYFFLIVHVHVSLLTNAENVTAHFPAIFFSVFLCLCFA